MLEQMIQSGNFTSTGADVILALRQDTDFIRVFNNATIGTSQNPGEAYICEWQRGLALDEGWVTYNTNGALTIQQSKSSTLGVNGFRLINDVNDPIIGVSSDVSAISNATQPQITTTTTAGLSDGDTIRMGLPATANLKNIGGYDFTINVDDGTHFTIQNPLANAPGAFGTGTGTWRQINRDPIFYPRVRQIVNLTSANPCVVTLSVTHDYVRGERIRLVIPSEFGSTELNNVYATITAVNPAVGTNTITLDLDTSAGITAFQFPLNGVAPFSKALVVPSGANQTYMVANNLDDLAAAYDNTAILGIKLYAGSLSPAGEDTDVIYWQAFKSGIVSNTV